MSCTIEFFFDFRSPYSYLAFTQLTKLASSIDFKPMKVLNVMEKVGNTPTTITCAAKGRYARVDLGRWANRYALRLNPSDMRENDGEAMARAVIVAEAQDKAAVTLTLFRAIWSEGRSLATSQAVVAELASAGIDTARIAARIDIEEAVRQLDQFTDEAAARGIFGSPTMIFNGQMFFGNDRVDFLREEIARAEDAA